MLIGKLIYEFLNLKISIALYLRNSVQPKVKKMLCFFFTSYVLKSTCNATFNL